MRGGVGNKKMALYLEDKEKEILRPLLRGIVEYKRGRYWFAESILKKIETDDKFVEIRHSCEHKIGIYKGEKKCCIKCGGGGEGMYEKWTLQKASK